MSLGKRPSTGNGGGSQTRIYVHELDRYYRGASVFKIVMCHGTSRRMSCRRTFATPTCSGTMRARDCFNCGLAALTVERSYS